MKERHLYGLSFLAGLSGAADQPTLGGKIDKVARAAMLTVIFLITLRVIIWIVLWPLLLPLWLVSRPRATSTGETSGLAKAVAVIFAFVFIMAVLPVFDQPSARPCLAVAGLLVIIGMFFGWTRKVLTLIGCVIVLVVVHWLEKVADWLGRHFKY